MPEENDGENASGEPKSESPITAQIQPTGNQNIPTKTAHDDSGNDKDETAELAREIRGGEKWLIGIGIATLLINSVIALIYWGQLKEMRKATSAETQASQTAKDTLTEMRSGSGAQDTHTLAQQAVTQANQTTNLAKAANTQTAELQDSVKQASRLARATEEANANVLEADRPWIGARIEVSNLEVGKSPTVTIVITNSGKRPARIDVSLERSGFYTVFPFDPGLQFVTNVPHSTSILVPGQENTMTATTVEALKQTDLDFAEGVHPLRTFFAFAKINYRDLQTNEPHFTHVCIYYIPRLKTPSDPGFRNCQEYNEAN